MTIGANRSYSSSKAEYIHAISSAGRCIRGESIYTERRVHYPSVRAPCRRHRLSLSQRGASCGGRKAAKAMRRRARHWRLHRLNGLALVDLASWTPPRALPANLTVRSWEGIGVGFLRAARRRSWWTGWCRTSARRWPGSSRAESCLRLIRALSSKPARAHPGSGRSRRAAPDLARGPPVSQHDVADGEPTGRRTRGRAHRFHLVPCGKGQRLGNDQRRSRVSRG
jgi:hypothetical protein